MKAFQENRQTDRHCQGKTVCLSLSRKNTQLDLAPPLAKVRHGGAHGSACLCVAQTGPHQLQQHAVQGLDGPRLRPLRPERHCQRVDDLEDFCFRVRRLDEMTRLLQGLLGRWPMARLL
eukprot:scaffold102714_cov63-Phaeocystis_antarctica.AAC.4